MNVLFFSSGSLQISSVYLQIYLCVLLRASLPICCLFSHLWDPVLKRVHSMYKCQTMQARIQTFLWGGSNRSNFGTFYDYAWIILRSRWIWPFWGGSDDPPDPPLATGLQCKHGVLRNVVVPAVLVDEKVLSVKPLHTWVGNWDRSKGANLKGKCSVTVC